MSEAPFRSVAIAGLGLIGGSIALALRERWPSIRVTGVDTPAVLAHVQGSGVLDHAVTAVSEIDAVDLLVLAAPVHENEALLEKLSAVPQSRAALVTDVGGTKRSIVAAATRLGLGDRFIGGHPLGGGERGGFAFARPDLFAGRAWIFTPADDAGADAAVAARAGERLDALTRFVSGLGARASTMDAAAHDRLMAYVSHLPQLAASALMDVVGAQVTADGLRLAGRGLVDTTRLSSSPVNVWRDICDTNADAIGTALDDLIARLQVLRDDLRGPEVDRLFGHAARARAELMKGRE